MSPRLQRPLEHLSRRPISWRGRSGRTYMLRAEGIENFVLDDSELYVLTEGDRPCWVGTAGDVIADEVSRAKFRAAVRVASSVLSIARPADAVASMTAAWDLEGGEPAPQLAQAIGA